MLKILIKQFFCRHEKIEVITESYSPENIFIVKSIIKCDSCGKTFAQHPNAACCYINHIHTEIIKEYWLTNLSRRVQLNKQE
jgi:hypothetical protein